MSLFSNISVGVPSSSISGCGLDNLDLLLHPALGLARKCLFNDDLPSLAQALYQVPEESVCHYLESQTQISQALSPEVSVPTFSFKSSHPVVEAERQISKDEDKAFLRLLKASCDSEKVLETSVKGEINISAINQSMATIESRDLVVETIIINPSTYFSISLSLSSCIDGASSFFSYLFSDKLESVGSLFTAQIYLSELIPKEVVYMCASPEYLGALVVRSDPHDNGSGILEEEIGMAIINQFSCHRLILEKNA